MPKESYIKPDIRSETLETEALCCYGSPGGAIGHCGWCGHPKHYGTCNHIGFIGGHFDALRLQPLVWLGEPGLNSHLGRQIRRRFKWKLRRPL